MVRELACSIVYLVELNLQVVDLHSQFLGDCLLSSYIIFSLFDLGLSLALSLLLPVNLLSQLLNLDIRLLQLFLSLLVALGCHVELAVDLVDGLLVLALGDVKLHLPGLGPLFLPVVARHHLLYLRAQLGYCAGQLLVFPLLHLHFLPELSQLSHLCLELSVLTLDFKRILEVLNLVLKDLVVVLQLAQVHLLSSKLLFHAPYNLVFLV